MSWGVIYVIWLIAAGTGIVSAIVGDTYQALFKRDAPEALTLGIWLSPIPIGMASLFFVS